MFGGCKTKMLREESDNKQNALQLENLEKEGGWTVARTWKKDCRQESWTVLDYGHTKPTTKMKKPKFIKKNLIISYLGYWTWQLFIKYLIWVTITHFTRTVPSERQFPASGFREKWKSFISWQKYRMEMNRLLELIRNSLQNRLRTANFPLPRLFRAHCDLLSAAFSLSQRRHLNTPPPEICQKTLFLHNTGSVLLNSSDNNSNRSQYKICKSSNLTASLFHHYRTLFLSADVDSRSSYGWELQQLHPAHRTRSKSSVEELQDLPDVFHPQQTTFRYLHKKQIQFYVLKCRSTFLIMLVGEKFVAYNFSHLL